MQQLYYHSTVTIYLLIKLSWISNACGFPRWKKLCLVQYVIVLNMWRKKKMCVACNWCVFDHTLTLYNLCLCKIINHWRWNKWVMQILFVQDIVCCCWLTDACMHSRTRAHIHTHKPNKITWGTIPVLYSKLLTLPDLLPWMGQKIWDITVAKYVNALPSTVKSLPAHCSFSSSAFMWLTLTMTIAQWPWAAYSYS